MKSAILVFLMTVFYSTHIFANDGLNDDLIYYSIGGGNALPGPASYRNTLTIGGSARLQIDGCGDFNLGESLRQQFDDFANDLDETVDALIFAATNGILTNLFWYLFRRADPNLADLLEDTLLRYEENHQIAIKSCQQAHREIQNGQNPFYDYITLGRSRKWTEASRDGNATAVETEQEIEEDGPACTPWINGQDRLCESGAEIDVAREVIEHGYSLLADDGGAGVNTIANSRLRAIWGSAAEASEWITQAFGDIRLVDITSSAPSGRAGRGVLPNVFEEAEEIREILVDVVSAQNLEITPEQEETLSVPGLRINGTVINTLKQFQNAELRNDVITRVATEIAFLRAMEKLNLSRRLVRAGMSDANVFALQSAVGYLQDHTLASIGNEYDALRNEFELRKTVSESTIQQIVVNHSSRLSNPTRGDAGIPATGRQLNEGAILKN